MRIIETVEVEGKKYNLVQPRTNKCANCVAFYSNDLCKKLGGKCFYNATAYYVEATK